MDNSTILILSNVLLSTLRDRYNELNAKNSLSYVLWSLLAVGILTLLTLHFAYRLEDIPGSLFITLIPIFLFFWSTSMIYLGFKIREIWLYVKYLERQLNDLIKILTKDKPEFQIHQKGYLSWDSLREEYFGEHQTWQGKKGLPRISIYFFVGAISGVYFFTGWTGIEFLLRTDLIDLNLFTATSYVIMLFAFAILMYAIFIGATSKLRKIKDRLESL